MTGEYVHFDVPDRMQALKMAIRRSRVPVLVNVSHSTLDGAIALADDALSSGAAGVLLLPPCFYPYHEEQLTEFYLSFRKSVAAEMPAYLYNHPFCGNRISERMARQLLASGQFTGLIDAGGTLLESPIEPGRVWLAGDRVYLDACRRGAAGCVSPVAAALPELLVALDRAIRSQSESRAGLLNSYLQEFLARSERLPPLAGIMVTAAARGWKLTDPPVPLNTCTRHARDQFLEWVRGWLPALNRAVTMRE
jgi:dihydrodipicolinate synthase/N-acetylneuraminate lyase